MKYSSSIHHLLYHFKDTSFWQLNQHAQDLQDYRDGLIGHWDDNASREINAQYLHQHELDDAQMRALLDKKHMAVQQLCDTLDEIDKVNTQVRVLSGEIQKLLVDCEEDLKKAVTNFDFAINGKNETDAQIPQTITLLNTANQNEFSPVI